MQVIDIRPDLISVADCWTKMGCNPIGPPSRSMYMLIELGRLWVLAHHLAWGGGSLLIAVM